MPENSESDVDDAFDEDEVEGGEDDIGEVLEQLGEEDDGTKQCEENANNGVLDLPLPRTGSILSGRPPDSTPSESRAPSQPQLSAVICRPQVMAYVCQNTDLKVVQRTDLIEDFDIQILDIERQGAHQRMAELHATLK